MVPGAPSTIVLPLIEIPCDSPLTLDALDALSFAVNFEVFFQPLAGFTYKNPAPIPCCAPTAPTIAVFPSVATENP